MRDPWDDSSLARQFLDTASTAEPRAPLYAALCRAIAADPAMYRLLHHAPEPQRRPVLLLAALHRLVLDDHRADLAAWFPTATSEPRRLDDPGLVPALRALVEDRSVELVELIATRSTQTNEVGRCSLFLPVFGLLAAEVGPIAHVDVGASAGLNLAVDRYDYVYEPGGEVRSDVHPSPVTLTCGTRGPVPVPRSMPTVAARRGIDRDPIDVTDDEGARWLQACVWTDQRDRFDRLSAAIDIARSDPPTLRRGDATALVGPSIEELVTSGHPVVTNSWVLCYLTPAERAAYARRLDEIGAAIDLTWVVAESPAETPELPAAPDLVGQHLTALTTVTWRGGRRTVRFHGTAHPHGYWLHWR